MGPPQIGTTSGAICFKPSTPSYGLTMDWNPLTKRQIQLKNCNIATLPGQTGSTSWVGWLIRYDIISVLPPLTLQRSSPPWRIFSLDYNVYSSGSSSGLWVFMEHHPCPPHRQGTLWPPPMLIEISLRMSTPHAWIQR